MTGMDSIRRAMLKMVLAMVLMIAMAAAVKAKSIDASEQEPYSKNQIELSRSLMDERPRDLQLFRYLLTSELFNRQPNLVDWDEQQRKRSYWKQCAFNAVSCFGKK